MGSTEDRQNGLLAELQHRVRSTLATTRMIVRRSAEVSTSLEDYVAHLDGRLSALARVQSAATRNPLDGIDLDLLLRDEMMSVEKSGRVHVSGPTLLLHPRAAEPFALALHELLTNAIKFGALSAPEGQLTVSWRIEERAVEPKHLLFDWVETGVELIEPDTHRKGFGTIVLQEMLKYNLDAQTDVARGPTGLVCRIVLPLTARVVV